MHQCQKEWKHIGKWWREFCSCMQSWTLGRDMFRAWMKLLGPFITLLPLTLIWTGEVRETEEVDFKHLFVHNLDRKGLNVWNALGFVTNCFMCRLFCMLVPSCGPGSVVSIVTGYGLDRLGIEFQWGVIFSIPVQTGPGTHPASCTMGTGSFPGVKSGRDVTLTPHPLLVPWSWKCRAIPLLPLWPVRPVQSPGACTRVHFTLALLQRLFEKFSASVCISIELKSRCTQKIFT